MTVVRVLVARFRGLVGGRRHDRDLDRELQFHLDMQAADNVRAGMPAAEARRTARLQFGPVEALKETWRDGASLAALEAAWRDVRFTMRTLRRNPGLTTTAVTVLALAIGANTAMMSVLGAVVLRPLPYPAPDRLVMLWRENRAEGIDEGRTTFQDLETLRDLNQSFVDLAAFDPVAATFRRDDTPHRISVARVTPSLFDLLGVSPASGRLFSDDEAAGRQRVAVLSHTFWQAQLGGADIIGQPIQLDNQTSVVVGILPATDLPLIDADVFEPHTLFPDWDIRRGPAGAASWLVVGRLRADVPLDRARAEMSALVPRLGAARTRQDEQRNIRVVPLHVQLTGLRTARALWMLTGAVLCLLLIAATNVASLLLARSTVREREIALRAALGATRLRVASQLVVESLTLTLIAGALGLLVAFFAIRVLAASAPPSLVQFASATLDVRTLAWTAALSIVTGVLVGAIPAATLGRRALGQAGRDGARGGSGVAIRRCHRALVVAECALAIVLLVGAGLLLRSFRAVTHIDPGFDASRVLSMQIARPVLPDADVRNAEFYTQLLAEVERVPGVERAGIIGDFFVGSSREQLVTAETARGQVSARLNLRLDEVSRGLFDVVGVPIIQGRAFSSADATTAQRVAIVNSALSRRLWLDDDPIGRRFTLGVPGSGAPSFTVVGVAGNMRRNGLENDPHPQMFELLEQNPSRLATLLVRTSAADPRTLAGPIQSAARRLDRDTSLYGLTTMDTRLDSFVAGRRFETTVLVAFSTIALLIAAIGMYGLLQYTVTSRTREIAIRIAVGAQAGEIFRMVLREGFALGVAGLTAGLIGALLVSRAGASLLFDVEATDPATFAVVSGLLTIVAAAAVYLPARRAMHVDPVRALRQ